VVPTVTTPTSYVVPVRVENIWHAQRYVDTDMTPFLRTGGWTLVRLLLSHDLLSSPERLSNFGSRFRDGLATVAGSALNGYGYAEFRAEDYSVEVDRGALLCWALEHWSMHALLTGRWGRSLVQDPASEMSAYATALQKPGGVDAAFTDLRFTFAEPWSRKDYIAAVYPPLVAVLEEIRTHTATADALSLADGVTVDVYSAHHDLFPYLLGKSVSGPRMSVVRALLYHQARVGVDEARSAEFGNPEDRPSLDMLATLGALCGTR
jgi:hypothetical protein